MSVEQADTILYIAGPMTGLPNFNYPAFFAAEDELRSAGYARILNPARTLVRPGAEWHEYMRAALAMLVQCNGLVMLPGSHNSEGARLEMHLADRLGIPRGPVEQWLRPHVEREYA